MELTIRAYHPTDEEDVIQLWHACNLVIAHNDPQRDIFLKQQFQPDLFLVGEVGTELVASIMAGYEGHRGWFNYLAVAPAFQRQGFGRQMVEAATVKLEALSCPKINLQIRTSNAQVVEFYQRLGFSIDEVVCMGKRL